MTSNKDNSKDTVKRDGPRNIAGAQRSGCWGASVKLRAVGIEQMRHRRLAIARGTATSAAEGDGENKPRS